MSTNASRPTSLYVPRPSLRGPTERAGTRDRDAMRSRIERASSLAGVERGTFTDCKYPGEPRWRIDARWVEFECGCRAERCLELHGATLWDPIIFRDLPEQSVYDHVCAFHLPAMNVRVHFGRFATFDQWHKARRRRLMGK